MDKNKIIEAAAKLVAKGAYDKAIKEYQKVLDADPKDVRILQKMGELYQKKNDNGQAAHYFTKVAESYSADGFFLKSVALYKQVLKLNPNLVDVNLKLAELHQQLGLMSEAMAYFQTVANAYDKQGDTRSSLDTLKKMVDLDPENVASRIKLAELYARENMEQEAGHEFKRAADYLKRNNRTDDYLRVAERISALEPENLELARELASTYLNKGDQKRALAKLQACFKADPKDAETLSLLAQAFQGLGQTSKTISVYKELAKIHGDRGRSDEVNKIWAKVAQLDPNDPDLAARSSPGQPAAAAPAHPHAHVHAPAPAPARVAQPIAPPPPAAAPAPPPPSNQALGRDQLAKLLTETDVYVKYGLHDKALEHLRKVFSVDPENLEAHEKAYNIYVAAGNHAQAGEQLINVLRLCARNGEVQRAQPYLSTLLQQNPAHPDVPTLLAVLRSGGGPVPPHAAEEVLGEESILVDSSDEEIIVADAPEDALAPQPEDLALASAGEQSEEVVEEEVMEEEGVPLGDSDIVPTDGAAYALSRDEPLGVAEEVAEDVSLSSDVMVPEEVASDTGEEVLPEYIDEVEPATQVNIAVPEELLDARATPTKPERYGRAAPPPADEAIEAPPDDEPAAEECDEAGFFLDQGLVEEAREILQTVLIAYPGHERATELMARLETMAPAEEPERGKDAFDLAAELADELGELGGAPEEEPASAAGDDFQYSVEEVFSEFKKGLEKVVKPEDVETHYDLGIAYKEMGLIDDAIGEFNVALQGCRGKKREIDCLTMAALLQLQKGDHGAAIETFKTALGSPHAIGETAKALEFELGAAWDAMGNPGKALYHYKRIAKQDPRYRDVGAIAQRLAATAKEEEDLVRAPSPRPSGANGVNGAHGKSDSNGRASTAPGEGSPPEPPGSKSRKVGYL
jgi:pilus assembly protein FimV